VVWGEDRTPLKLNASRQLESLGPTGAFGF
jgi:hypothetical protein